MILRSQPTDGVRILRLNDPERRNALSSELVGALLEELTAAASDTSCHAIILTGEGSAFCAGAVLGDLDALAAQPDGGAKALSGIYEGFLAVRTSPLLTIAAVNGAAVGAGLNLALAADICVASPKARFDPKFLHIGLHPGGGHTYLLQQAVGPVAAAAMLLAGESVDGQRAVQLGLAWSCVDDPVAEAVRLATAATVPSRELLMRTKASLRATRHMSEHAEAVAYELPHQVWSAAHRQRRD